MKQVLPVFHGTYIRTVSSQLHFSFDTFDPFLPGPGKNGKYGARWFAQTAQSTSLNHCQAKSLYISRAEGYLIEQDPIEYVS